MKELKEYIPGKYYFEVKALKRTRSSNIIKMNKEGMSILICDSLIEALIDPSSSLFLFPVVNSDLKIGFMNQKCEIVIEPSFDSVNGAFFKKDSIVAVCKDNQWNVIDVDGKELLNAWTKHNIFPSRDSRIITINSKSILNVDIDKEPLKIKDVISVGRFRYGFARIHRKSGWGVINKKGEEVIPAKYEAVYSFYDYPEPTTIVKEYNSDEKKLIQLNDL